MENPDEENGDRDGNELEITNLNEFTGAAKPLTHFKVHRKCCGNLCCSYYHHFIVISQDEKRDQRENTSMQTVTIVQYGEAFFGSVLGVGELKAEEFELNEEGIGSLCTFEEGLLLVPEKENTPEEERKIIANIMLRIGERAYHASDNNCEHAVSNFLKNKHEAPDADKIPFKTRLCGATLECVKGIGFVVSMLITFIAAGLGTIVRRAYSRVLVALLVSYVREDPFTECTSPISRDIIKATKELLMEERYQYPYSNKKNITFIIQTLNAYFDTDSVCEVAEKYGNEVFMKTMAHALGIWVCLQTAYICLYLGMHLIPMRRVFDIQNQGHKYCKYVCLEVIAGYIPIALTSLVSVVLQYYLDTPEVAYFFVTIFAFACFRFLITWLFFCLSSSRGSNCKDCYCRCCDKPCNTFFCSHCFCYNAKRGQCVLISIGCFLIVSFIICYSTFIIFHYLWPSLLEVF